MRWPAAACDGAWSPSASEGDRASPPSLSGPDGPAGLAYAQPVQAPPGTPLHTMSDATPARRGPRRSRGRLRARFPEVDALLTTLLTELGATGYGLFGGPLASAGVFPQPLSAEDEAKIVQRLALGDEAARNQLVERNMRLVAHIVKKFDNTGEDIDDLISIGTIGLIKAINTFDPNRNARL